MWRIFSAVCVLVTKLSLASAIAPEVEDASFSSDGSSVVVQFVSSTDRGGYTSSFVCSDLLNFDNVASATCQWSDDSTIVVFPGSTGTIVVSDSINFIAGNNIKDKVAPDSEVPTDTINIHPPVDSVLPQISIRVPASVSSCSDINFDLSQSYGSGGRSWLSVSIAVYQDGVENAAIQNDLSSRIDAATLAPLVIDSSLLTAGSSYTFRVTLCNFLDACGIGQEVSVVNLGSTPVLNVKISSGDLSMLTGKALGALSTQLSTLNCGNVPITDLTYSWEISGDGAPFDNIISDPTKFKVAAWQLTPNSEYTVTVSVTALANAETITSSDSITVTVGSGSVVPVLSGAGSTQSVRAGETITMDASGSYHQDAEDGGSPSDFLFKWSCSGSCNDWSMDAGSWSSSSTVGYTIPSASIGGTASISVRVKQVTDPDSEGVISSPAALAVSAADAPSVAITTPSSDLTSVNTQKKLIISANVEATQVACDAFWSCSDSALNWGLASGTTATIPAETTRGLSLLLPAAMLPARSSLTFTLTCGTSASTAIVTTNGAPLPGAFSVNPSTGGIELTTSFLLAASGWSDSATDYPLSYTFGFNDANNAFKSLKAATLSTYINSAMSASTTVVVVRVADIYGAFGSLSANVVVDVLGDSTAQNAAVSTMLAGATTVDETNNAVSVGSAVLNSASCADETECASKQSTREDLASGLVSNAAAEDVSTETISSRSTLLSSVASDSAEVSETAADAILIVGATVTDGANEIDDFSYEDMEGTLDAVDTAGSVLLSSESRRRLTVGGAASTTESILNIVKGYNKMVRKQIVTGKTYSKVGTTFRTAAAVSDDGEVTISTPLVDGETSKGSIKVVSSTGSAVSASLISTSKSAYGSLGDSFDGDAMQVSIDSEGIITFNMPHSEEKTIVDPSLLQFNTTCYGGNDASVHEYHCISDDSTLSVTCDPELGPGIITSYCPALTPTCSLIVDGETVESNCVATDFQPTYTTCECTVGGNGRRLSSDELEQSGAMNIVSISEYLGQEYLTTFNQADDLTSLAALSRVLIVLLMFTIMWAGGLAMLFACWYRRRHMTTINMSAQAKLERKMQSAQISRSPAAVRAYLVEYISEIFPSVFSDKPTTLRLVDEIKRHHRYLTLFTAEPGSKGDTKRLLTGLEMLSIQTMLMFLLAMLYDLEGPDDDGSCESNLTENSCLSRKAMFDSTRSYCRWSDNQQLCEYQNPRMTLNVMIIIAVLVAIFTAVFQRPIDMIFELLGAPTADAVKAKAQADEGALAEAGRRLSTMARRVSVVAGAAAKKVSDKVRQNSSVGAAVREMPESTEAAYGLARASMDVIQAKSQQQLQTNSLIRYQSFVNSNRGPETFTTVVGAGAAANSVHSSDSSSQHSSNSDESNADNSSDSESEKADEVGAGAGTKRGTSSAYDVARSSGGIVKKKSAFDELKLEIACQRKVLRAAEMEEFDAQWGVDPTGEFVHADNSVMDVLCMRRKLGAEEQIRKELDYVEKATKEKIEKLTVATDSHAGLEILHLFVKDLLGRETAAARIFEIKSDEDFKHTSVVTVTAKRRAILFLVLLNIFFVYYSLLKGYAKGIDWQRTYLAACIAQFVIEIFLFETMECVYINFLVPALVSNDVRHAGDAINDVVTQLCSTTPIDAKYFLNMPDYLFVSTNVAKEHPELMESIIVRSYHSHVPGEIAKKWHMGSIARIERHESLRRMGALAVVLATLQQIATAPFMFQRMLIRFVQPFFLTGIITLYMAVVTNTTSIAVTCVILAVAIGLLVIKHYKSKSFKSTNDRPITPVRSGQAGEDTRNGAESNFPESNMHLPVDDAADVQIELAESPPQQRQTAAHSDYSSSRSSNSNVSDGDAKQTMVESN